MLSVEMHSLSLHRPRRKRISNLLQTFLQPPTLAARPHHLQLPQLLLCLVEDAPQTVVARPMLLLFLLLRRRLLSHEDLHVVRQRPTATSHRRAVLRKVDSLHTRLAILPAVRRRVRCVVYAHDLAAKVNERAVARTPRATTARSRLNQGCILLDPAPCVQWVAAVVPQNSHLVLVRPRPTRAVDYARPAAVRAGKPLRALVDTVLAAAVVALLPVAFWTRDDHCLAVRQSRVRHVLDVEVLVLVALARVVERPAGVDGVEVAVEHEVRAVDGPGVDQSADGTEELPSVFVRRVAVCWGTAEKVHAVRFVALSWVSGTVVTVPTTAKDVDLRSPEIRGVIGVWGRSPT